MPTALITGASSGLGEQFAYALARQRHDLVLVARRGDRLEQVAARAKELGAARVEIKAMDLGRRETPQAICDQLKHDQIEIHYLVNNAGFGTSGRFNQLALERELEEIDLNVTALVNLTHLLLPAMIARHGGTIINVASTAAFQPVPYMTTYAATKAFVLSFTEGLAGELAGSGIRVMALCPGPVKTEFQAVARNERAMVPSFVWVPAERVVADAIAAAASGRMIYIAGALNFVTAQS
ncbi:MAG: SDR family NAD(P)-dependent oxidoreductase, partial [Candidatus Binataceae bacterium]